MADPAADHSLTAVGVFRDLSPEDRAAMEAELDKIQLARGEALVRQGEAADALYIVVSGRFGVFVRGRDAPVAEIGPGMPIGEIAFLAGGERTATVMAVRDSLVLRLGRAEFERLCQRAPQIWRTLTATLANRLADQTAGRSEVQEPVPRTITLVPAGRGSMPETFVELIRSAFAQHCRTQTIRSSDVPALAGGSVDPSSGELTEKLNALESANDLVIYVADSGLTPWSEKAIRQADLVLRVGVADPVTLEDVPESPHERFAARLLAPTAQRLVLLHERRRAPVGTRHWLAPRNIRMHHHVALSDRADADRLVRFVLGRALGLVTCGGGAFCAAHVGLYKALTEAGVAFDVMGGTSGGSAMAAAFAMGVDPEEIAEVIKEVFVTQRAMRRYTLPRYSVLDHTYFDRLLGPHYKGTDIEDLWIPFFAISTNLSRYSLHRHTHGDLWHAVRASGSVPGLLPPFYTDDGQMLVDGCLLDNVPVRVMHELKRGPNVVIAFEVPQLERFSVDYQTLPSRGELLRRMVLPFRGQPLPAAPSIGSVLLRSLMANRQDFERHLRTDDLLLVPPLPTDMGILDWGRHGELIRESHAWCAAEVSRRRHGGHSALERAGLTVTPAIPRSGTTSTRRDQS
ncbi:MAG TPA: patatin-like phospholipase family protein [Hyphomicrobiaceae bacterium]|nr:patatin-like phospholipase family protein [Hyphomicrobiaceae bacterium]